MRKVILIVLSLILCLSIVGCYSEDDKYTIEIVVPAGSMETFVYSDVEFSPKGDKIRVSLGDKLFDTEVVLKGVDVKEENTYLPEYLTHGMPVEMDVEKGAWFKIGISVQNDTDEDKYFYVVVEGIELRTE